MKHLAILGTLFLSLIALNATAADTDSKPSASSAKADSCRQGVMSQYKYQIAVDYMNDADGLSALNNKIDEITAARNSNRGVWKDIADSYKSTATQKTVNATSNLVELGVNLIVNQLQKNSKNFESWSKAKQKECVYTQTLSDKEQIEDFYYKPSTQGALDPRNLKFKGFSCRNYLEVSDSNAVAQKLSAKPSNNTTPDKAMAGNKGGKKDDKNHYRTAVGQDAFIVACSLREDSLGIAHMVNHSKFYLQVDSLIFYPKYCNIPNINGRGADETFSFDEFSNLEFQFKVTLTSSWINEAVMVYKDQALGEFIITAKITSDMLDKDGRFYYDGKYDKTIQAVTINGDSFIVPRSYIGTSEASIWGTGQYKLNFEISESCQLNSKHYLKNVPIDKVGNAEAVSFANLPGYKSWQKEVWQTEWHRMNTRPNNSSFFKNVWTAIKTAYLGDNWVKELVSPAATVIYLQETKVLNKLFDLDATVTTAAATGTSSTTVGAANTGGATPSPMPNSPQ
jgi:hypothetical protein